MAERLTANVFYQNTVREYSGNAVHQFFPETRKESFHAKFPSSRNAYFQQEDLELQYRFFTYRVFKDSNVLNEVWQKFNIPNILTYYHKSYYDSHEEDTILCRTAEKIIQELASQKSAAKILLGIFKKAPQLYYHSIEVMCLSLVMAHRLGYNEDSMYEIGMAAVLHDIGKVLLPCELLHLTKEPDNNQRQKLQKIPFISSKMAKKSGITSIDTINGILSHQENYIGTGFPSARMQHEIHPYGMLVHVADDYDTILLRKKESAYARNYIRKMTCRRYSFAAVSAFNDIFQ